MLIDAGFESGHAYGKSLRTVKSCVGSSWCRYGIGDSVGLAIRLEERYKSIRSPHKFKEVYPDVQPDKVVPMLDRFIMFYIRTADRLQRTARWLEAMEGGMTYLRSVILDDKLGICKELEEQMEELVGKFECEWTAVVKDPKKREEFRQFVNTDKNLANNVEEIMERGQSRPANWPKKSTTYDFKNQKWSRLEWEKICSIESLKSTPAGASATILRGDTQLAIFHVKGRGFFASQAMCPHRKAMVLAQGIIGDDETGEIHVSCPMHKRNYILDNQKDPSRHGGCKNDEDVSVATFPCEKREDGYIYLKLPPVPELDEVLGTTRWKVRKEDTRDEGMAALDKKFRMKPIPGTPGTTMIIGEKNLSCIDFVLCALTRSHEFRMRLSSAFDRFNLSAGSVGDVFESAMFSEIAPRICRSRWIWSDMFNSTNASR
ncbi:hypothetical protein MRB53_040523 [Persea americana]|nr:hypothetical protein MRB53_040523 [Persea americana]